MVKILNAYNDIKESLQINYYPLFSKYKSSNNCFSKIYNSLLTYLSNNFLMSLLKNKI
jgi:hypothetical protein